MNEKINIILGEDETITEINDRLSLIQNKNGLTFGTDALLLASYVKKRKGDIAYDLGCGTGVISLLCASRGNYGKIYACEIQEEYYEITKRNVELNGFNDVIVPILSDIRRLTENSENIGKADVVFSNPPYMTCDGGFNCTDIRKDTARRELNGNINDFCACASRLLRFGGEFYIVYRPERLADLMLAMRKNGLEPKKLTFVMQTSAHQPSILLMCAKKGASPFMTVTRPIILYDNGAESEDYKKIYSGLPLEI